MPSRRIIESWLKSITPFTFTPDELSDRLLNLGLEVEVVEDLREKLHGFVVGEVLTREKHPNADKLSLCTVADGNGTHTVVCGAPNVAAGQKIAFAPVGTYIATADFTISRRAIRGIESEGMICSEAELGLGEGHDGILVLPDSAQVGMPLADLLGDIIYEVDLTPNRADCLSHLGVAREIAALTGGEIFLPPNEIVESSTPVSEAVSVSIEDPDLCPRYAARVVRGVTIGPSPVWLQETMKKLGIRSINNVVDAASYVMFECGHPLHAFDLGTVAGGRIVVRPVSGEKFTTLDGKEHQLPEKTLMICDAEKPVAIAGIMGGANSEITDATVDVLIESAYFNPSSIRRSAKRLGLSTDASYRFERGADMGNVLYAVDRAAYMIATLAGGEVLAGIVDEYPNVRPQQIIELRYARTEEILGLAIEPAEQDAILTRLGFIVDPGEEGRCMVSVPSYRVDVYGEVDLVEEIARLYDYDRIPVEPRALVSFDTNDDPVLKLIEATRTFLLANGFSEIVSLYLTDPESAAAYGEPVTLRNALGRDYSTLRTSLAPSIARVVALNQRHSRPDQKLFEIGKAFRAGRDDQGVIPGIVETIELAVTMTGRADPIAWDIPARGFDIYDLRGVVDRFMSSIGIPDVTYAPTEEAKWGIDAPALSVYVGGVELGRLGPMDRGAIGRASIDGTPVLALFDIEELARRAFVQGSYTAPSRYPVVNRDISIVIDAATSNAAVEQTIRGAGRGKGSGGDLLSSVALFDLYVGKGVPDGKKSLAYALSFTPHERTLEDAEVEEIMNGIIAALRAEHGAELRA